MTPHQLEDRLNDFSVLIIGVVEALPGTKAGNHVAGQLLRSGTSPAPNYGEARSAESRRDFIHKMKVSLKELRETPDLAEGHRTEAVGRLSRSSCRAGGVLQIDCDFREQHENGGRQWLILPDQTSKINNHHSSIPPDAGLSCEPVILAVIEKLEPQDAAHKIANQCLPHPPCPRQRTALPPRHEI